MSSLEDKLENADLRHSWHLLQLKAAQEIKKNNRSDFYDSITYGAIMQSLLLYLRGAFASKKSTDEFAICNFIDSICPADEAARELSIPWTKIRQFMTSGQAAKIKNLCNENLAHFRAKFSISIDDELARVDVEKLMGDVSELLNNACLILFNRETKDHGVAIILNLIVAGQPD